MTRITRTLDLYTQGNSETLGTGEITEISALCIYIVNEDCFKRGRTLTSLILESVSFQTVTIQTIVENYMM